MEVERASPTDVEHGAVPDDAVLIPVGRAAKQLGCSPSALKKLAQARDPKVRGLAPGQGRNRSHQWVFVQEDVAQRAALVRMDVDSGPVGQRRNESDLVAAYELADSARQREREDRLQAMIAERDRRIEQLESDRDRLWDALVALRPNVRSQTQLPA